MSARLDAYLALESVMLRLDERGDEVADLLRDAMDPLWYALSAQDRTVLNERPPFRLGETGAQGRTGEENLRWRNAPLESAMLQLSSWSTFRISPELEQAVANTKAVRSHGLETSVDMLDLSQARNGSVHQQARSMVPTP